MQEVDLDIEGIKKILTVEIGRSVKHSQHIKLDTGTSEIKKYESLLKNEIEKKDFQESMDKEDQSLIAKVDERIEQHMKNLRYKSTKKSLQFKRLRTQLMRY